MQAVKVYQYQKPSALPSEQWCAQFLGPADSAYGNNLINKHPDKAIYSSMYSFHPVDVTNPDKIMNTTTLYTDWLILDIDNKKDPSTCRTLVKEFAQFLCQLGLDSRYLLIAYSGSKGYNLYIPTAIIPGFSPGSKLNRQLVHFTKELSGAVKEASGLDFTVSLGADTKDTDIPSVDLSIIKKRRSVVRLIGSKHLTTGRHKIAFSYSEFMKQSHEEIVVLASTKINLVQGFIPCPKHPSSVLEALQAYWLPASEAYKVDKFESVGKTKVERICIQRELESGAKDFRNNTAYVLATHFREVGLNQKMTNLVLTDWLQRGDSKDFPLDALQRTIQSAYSRFSDLSCKEMRDVLGTSACIDCPIFQQLEKLDGSIYAGPDQQLILAAKEIASRSVNGYSWGVDELDKAAKRKILPKEKICILGAPGSGKTLTIQNMLDANSCLGARQGFISLEMDVLSIVKKLIAKRARINDEALIEADILNYFKGKPAPLSESFYAYYGDKYKFWRGKPTRENITEFVSREQLDIVYIDYLQLMYSDFGSPTEYSSNNDIADFLKDLCETFKVTAVVLSQPDSSLEPGDRPNQNRIRNKGGIVDAFDYILGVYQKQGDWYNDIRYTICKARYSNLGANKHLDLAVTVDFPTQTIDRTSGQWVKHGKDDTTFEMRVDEIKDRDSANIEEFTK